MDDTRLPATTTATAVDVRRPPVPVRDPAAAMRRAIAAVRRRKWFAIATALVVLGAVLAWGFSRQKLYTATANMVVNSREVNLSEKDKEVLPGVPTADNAVDTEVEILRSSAVAVGTVEALGLTDNPVFAKAIASMPAATRETAAAAILMANLKVARPGESKVVAIQYTSPDPALSKAVADQVGHQYLAVKRKARLAAVEQVDRGLGNELDSLRGKLEAADAAVAAYRAQHDLFDSQGQNTTFTQQELSTYKQQQAAAEAAAADARAKLGTARGQTSAGARDAVGAVLESPVVQQLRNKRAELAASYADMASRYQPDHPDMVRAREQLDALDAAIGAETRRQLQNLGANARIANSNVAQATGTVNRTTGQLAADTRATVQLAQLQRRADVLRDTYQTLLARRNSIDSQALVADDDARIFSPAIAPLRPSSPNKPLILLIGLALATIAAGAVVWLLEAFDRKLVSSADIESKLGVPHLANLPEVSSIARGSDLAIAPVDYVVERPHSLYAEQLRAIRLALLRHGRSGMASVGITSARPHEGKSTLSISLARAAALSGSRTLLIDGDLRRPSVAGALGVPSRPGLIEVLGGGVAFADALAHDVATGLAVLAAGDIAEARADTLDAAKIDALLAAAADAGFDLVIVDCAPALAVADARLLLRQMDDVLLALRWNDTPRQIAAATIDRLRALRVEPLGIVATRVDMQALARFAHDDVDAGHATYGAYHA